MADKDPQRPLDAALDRAEHGEQVDEQVLIAETPPQDFILMRLGARWFAIPALMVQRVVMKGTITRVPGHSDEILGIALLHDGLVPVLDLESMAKTGEAERSVMTEPRMVVMSDGENTVAVLADEARGVESFVVPALSPGKGVVRSEFYYDDKQICLLDVDALIGAAQHSGDDA